MSTQAEARTPPGRLLTIVALALVIGAIGTGVQARDAGTADAVAKAAPAEVAAPAAAIPGSCQAAGNGPCCTSCREKAQDAAAPHGECPCQRARRLREQAARAQQ